MMSRQSAQRFDAEVIVVGGGPAGSAVAGLLASQQHDVLLLDKARFPRQKACSEYLNPEAVAVLEQIGALDLISEAEPHWMKRMTVHAPGGREFIADFDGVQPGRRALGLSRMRLDALLLDFARSRGVRVIEHGHVRDVVRDGERVVGVEAVIDGQRQILRARLVIGADGRHSVVARSLGLSREMPWMRRTGLIAHYRDVAGFDDHGEMHVGSNGYAGIAPLEDGLFNVAFVSASTAVAARNRSVEDYFTAGLNAMPTVAERLRGATRVDSVIGVGPMAHRARRTAGDGFLLVGDAAGFLDPFTGEGIYEALRAAQLAAPIVHRALVENDLSASALAPYRTERLHAFAAKRQVSWIVQGFVQRPPLMNYVTTRLGERDDVGRTLTGVLGDFESAWSALSPRFLARLLQP